MFNTLSYKLYEKIRLKYPAVISMYERYKSYNSDFHSANKRRSAMYLLRLIIAHRSSKNLYTVRLPDGAENSPTSSPMSTAPTQSSDTSQISRLGVLELAAELEEYSVISFDVFDTLIFRPFAVPSDMFYLVGEMLGHFDFREVRILAERDARRKTLKPNYEIDIYDIYKELSLRTSLSISDAECEIALEEKLCYPNPYMLELFKILLARGKTIVIVSDMYLPRSVIARILRKNGFFGYSKLYVSSERGHSKSTGKLFSFVKRDYGDDIIHVGDNRSADVLGAQRAKISAYHYTQCNEFGNHRRPASLISPYSSLYKGIVNNFIYNGYGNLTERESFAFTYAAPIVVGFCEWINRFAKEQRVGKILFLARDMYVFHKIYNRHFGQLDNEYVAVSRFALQQLIVADYPEEYFKHTVAARCDRGYTLARTLSEMNLDFLIAECARHGISPEDVIVTDKLARIRKMIICNKDRIAEHFSDNERAARIYFETALNGARRVCVADLGWRGSILAYLRHLLVVRWKLCDEVFGVLVGSSASESTAELTASGTVTAFAYSHIHNRDLLASPNYETEYIRVMMLEAIFTSDEGSLLEYRLKSTGGIELYCGAPNPNKPIIREFVRGIERFADELERVRRDYRKYYPISAVDAIVPMLEIAKNHEYIARIIGDVCDTPFAVAGIGVEAVDYVALGELMRERHMIARWPQKS